MNDVDGGWEGEFEAEDLPDRQPWTRGRIVAVVIAAMLALGLGLAAGIQVLVDVGRATARAREGLVANDSCEPVDKEERIAANAALLDGIDHPTDATLGEVEIQTLPCTPDSSEMVDHRSIAHFGRAGDPYPVLEHYRSQFTAAGWTVGCLQTPYEGQWARQVDMWRGDDRAHINLDVDPPGYSLTLDAGPPPGDVVPGDPPSWHCTPGTPPA